MAKVRTRVYHDIFLSPANCRGILKGRRVTKMFKGHLISLHLKDKNLKLRRQMSRLEKKLITIRKELEKSTSKEG